jgi:hypothetical protein
VTTDVSCGVNLPVGTGGIGGFMGINGMVAGQPHILQIWSAGPAPGTVTHTEVWNGSAPWNGTIAYANMTSAGYRAFNWAKGATLDIDLPAFEGATGTVHITGTVVCTSLYNS